jgi:uncharacterized protein YbjT (DUF2867 family)
MKENTIIILGAGGQVGSMIVRNLVEKNIRPKAVIRNKSKEEQLKTLGAEVCICDLLDGMELEKIIADGNSLFVLTPENPFSENPLLDTETILANIYKAVRKSKIKHIVGLSSGGAHLKTGSGNLMMSRMLEDAFVALQIKLTFVRPGYYYSNWIGYLDMIKDEGLLPTFFPKDLKIQMIAPSDVALFISNILCSENSCEGIYEIIGPEEYNSADIAKTFGQLLNKNVEVNEIAPILWGKTLENIGFSPMAIKLMIEMTDCVVKGKTKSEDGDLIKIKTDTTFEEYLNQAIIQSNSAFAPLL